MRDRFRFRDFDWFMLLVVVGISAVGVLEIYSTTAHTALAGEYRRQMFWVVAGCAVLFLVSRWDYHGALRLAPALYALSLLGLGAVLILGGRVARTHRWIRIGGQSLQVSEFAKLVIIVGVAAYLAGRVGKPVRWKDLIALGLLGGVPALLVALEPDLGTALTYLSVIAVAALLIGVRARQWMVLGLIGALALPIGWRLTKPYQRERLTSFTHPSEDTRGAGYQVAQSMIAIGSGGFWGKGIGNGTQSQLGFIPVSHADFIFAAFAEEQGFAGTLGVLLLYLALILRLLDGAHRAPDAAGALLVAGFSAVLFFQVAVNVGMMIGLLPITGIPLPLMSQGGSSILVTFAGLGLAMSAKMRRFVN